MLSPRQRGRLAQTHHQVKPRLPQQPFPMAGSYRRSQFLPSLNIFRYSFRS